MRLHWLLPRLPRSKAPWLGRELRKRSTTYSRSRTRWVYRPGLEWLESRLAPAVQNSPATLFSLTPALPVGKGPTAVATGDFNGDGKLDIVAANYQDNTVSVLLGNGNGTFLPPVFDSVGSRPTAVAIGDFNGNGKLDIATANAGDNTVSVLLGNGNGTFLPTVPLSVGLDPYGVAVGDFSGNGKLDIATANLDDNTVSVLLGNGNGTFQPAASYAVGPGPDSMALGDFNGDGKLDITTANAGDNTASVLLGNGNGSFLPEVSFPVGNNPGYVAVGSFTGDGNLDIVTSNFSGNTVSVLLGNGNGSFLPSASFPVGNGPNCVTVGDFNGDGNLDMATSNQTDNTVSVLLGNGNGSFLPQVSFTVGNAPDDLAIGDFIGDGNLDIATANYGDNTVSVLLGADVAHDTLATALPLPFSGNQQSQLSGSNANVEVQGALAASDQMYFKIVVPNAVDLTATVTPAAGSVFVPLLSVYGSSGQLLIQSDGAGTANSSAQLTQPLEPGTYFIAVSSLTSNFSGKKYFELAATSGPISKPFQALPVGVGPQAVAVADLNGDGKLDLVTANVDNTVSVLLGMGDGTFAPAVNYCALYVMFAVFSFSTGRGIRLLENKR